MNQVKKNNNILQYVIIVAAACLVHGVMQGVHDNYGIMMNGLLKVTGIDYAAISFCIGAGALVYGFAQPFLGMLALKKSNAFVILLGIAFQVYVLALLWVLSHRCWENAERHWFPELYRQAPESGMR